MDHRPSTADGDVPLLNASLDGCCEEDGCSSGFETVQPTTYQEHDLPSYAATLATPESERVTTDMFAFLSLGDQNIENIKPGHWQAMSRGAEMFADLSPQGQVLFVQMLLSKMGHLQLGTIEDYIRPMLMRDFIALLPDRLSEQILQYLDSEGLLSCELVSRVWRSVIAYGQLWRRLIEKKVRTDATWCGLAEKRGWIRFLLQNRTQSTMAACAALGFSYEQKGSTEFTYRLHTFYRDLYPRIQNEIRRLEDNWRHGRHTHRRIDCQSENSRGVYCLQYDDDKIVSGLRDNTIKIWNRDDLSLKQVLTGHTGSVLCLQYDSRIIISGSSDATVRVWDIQTGECLNTLIHHGEAVLHLRFGNGRMVTCSKDRSIAVWDMASPQEITVRRVLVGHRAAVNAVDFDNTHIVSGSGDRTIKVWSIDTCEFVRTLAGHRRGIACLQYRDGLVVSGSSDNTIRLWEIAMGACIRVLEGHNELVRCIRFDSKRIISGAYDGKIKIWDMKAALDPRSPAGSLCLATLEQHQGRVFRLQFDEFQIVSSSHDDTIVIWDFLDVPPAQPEVPVDAGPIVVQVPVMDDADVDGDGDADGDADADPDGDNDNDNDADNE